MSETDRRLKDQLNGDQVRRERMCLELLTVQKSYNDVTPRLPKGGPDGGRDIQGYHDGELCFGAVGFVNDATDTEQHRNQIQQKFKDDLEAAMRPKKGGTADPKGFVFLTNVGLTPRIINDLKKLAYAENLHFCDIFDRERLRVILDSNKGYAIRQRYLDIPLSDAEQKDFFSTWADEINSVIGSGLHGIDQTTRRIQFLLEAQSPLNHLAAIVKLDCSLWEACGGRFVFETVLSLRVMSNGLLSFKFGGGSNEIVETLDAWKQRGGHTRNGQYGYAFTWLVKGMPQHDLYIKEMGYAEGPKTGDKKDKEGNVRTFNSSAILEVDRNQLYFEALSEPFLFRFQPTCTLLELDRCMIIFHCTKALADHIEQIQIVGGGYQLLTLGRSDMQIRTGSFERFSLPNEAVVSETDHEWVTISPAGLASAFSIDISSKTPRRYDW